MRRKGFQCTQGTTPYPNVPRLLCFFLFFFLKLTSLSPSWSPPSPANISQTNYTQPFERFAAACRRRLSVIRQHRHSILHDPSLGTLTRKLKPRADKQAPGHGRPQPEARHSGEHRSQQSQAAFLVSGLKDRRLGLPYVQPSRGKGSRIRSTQPTTQDHQAMRAFLPPCRALVVGADKNRQGKVLVGTGGHTC